MKAYSYSAARQQLAELLRCARREGQVEIRRRDGQVFVVRPAASTGSPLDVPGVDTDLSTKEILGLVRESRRSSERFLKKVAPPKVRLHPAGARRRQGSATRRRARPRG